MPNPEKFKNEKEWMSACMSQLKNVERKDHDQAVVQCLNIWRQRKKKASKIVHRYLKGESIDMENIKKKEAAQRVVSIFLKNESDLSYGEKKRYEKKLREQKREKTHGKPSKIGDPMNLIPGEPVGQLEGGKLVVKPWDPNKKKREEVVPINKKKRREVMRTEITVPEKETTPVP